MRGFLFVEMRIRPIDGHGTGGTVKDMEEYITRGPEGVALRGEHQDRFFSDLHETVRRQLFGDADVLYEEIDDENVEITLPPPDELIECTMLRFKGDCFHVVMDFPAMIIGSSDDKVVRRAFDYVPPALDAA